MTTIFGIPNMSNTCFMAAVLQLVMSSEGLYSRLRDKSVYFANFQKNRSHTMYYFIDLFKRYPRSEGYVLGRQEDSSVFLAMLFKEFKKCFQKIVIDRVYLKNEIGSYSQSSEDVIVIDVIGRKESLQVFLTDFYMNKDKELRPDEDDYTQQPVKVVGINNYSKLPDELIIQFNRYFQDEHGDQVFKEEYDISENIYMIENGRQVAYFLRSFVYHVGSLNGGHYTCYRKMNGQWYLCNDSSITLERRNIPIKKGFIFLYERIGIISDNLESINENVNLETLRNIVRNFEDERFIRLFPNLNRESLIQEDPKLKHIFDEETNQMANLYAYLLDGALFWIEQIRLEKSIKKYEELKNFKLSASYKSLLASGEFENI